MPENRFFHPALFAAEGDLITLTTEELHHLRVMRIHQGDILELVNGQNQLAKAEVNKIEKKNATLTITTVKDSPPPPQQIILGLAHLRPKNLDLVIEKGVELGATAFWLFPSERSDKKTLAPSQISRLHQIAISALKQCGRLDLPPILEKPSLTAWPKPPLSTYHGDFTPKAKPLTHSKQDILILIGPESGFSPSELAHLTHIQSVPTTLNSNTLRAETAAIAALAILTQA